MDSSKVSAREKISYFFANLSDIPVMTLINMYLMIFYTNVCGIDPKAVATLFLVARILDGFNDPITGYIVDHMPSTKMGHFRPSLLIGGIICGINFLLLWFGPMMLPAGKIVIAYITYLLIGITFDIMDISLNSLLPVMTEDENQRNKLSSIKGIAYTFGAVGVGIISPLILKDASDPKGYVVLISLFTAIIIRVFDS